MLRRRRGRVWRVAQGRIAVTMVFGGGSLAWALFNWRMDALIFALGVWALIAMAWTVSVHLHRDIWSPAAVSTAAFLDLSILRARRRRQAIVAQVILYVLVLAFDLAWIYTFGLEGAGSRDRGWHDLLAFLASGRLAWVWGVTAAFGIVAVIRRRKFSREIATLTRLRASQE